MTGRLIEMEVVMDDNAKLPNSLSESALRADPGRTLSRREFPPRAAAAITGIMLLPRHVLAGPGYTAASDKLCLVLQMSHRIGGRESALCWRA